MAQSVEKVYAEALFELCSEDGSLESVNEELCGIRAALDENKDIVKLLSAPTLSNDEKHGIISSVFKGRVSDTVYNFISLLTDKSRLTYFDGICEEFRNLYNEAFNIAEITVTTAAPLKTWLKEKLVAKLESVLNKKVILTEKLSPSILGGIVVNYGNVQMDSSLKTRLEKIRAQIDSVMA